jgi:DNA transformation protein
MGEKGTKLTQKANEMCRNYVESLASTGDISSRKMFGGYGIFESGVMFALVNSEGELYMKANKSNMTRFEKAGSKKHGKMLYYSVPGKVVNDRTLLCEWAKDSIEIAHSSKKK